MGLRHPVSHRPRPLHFDPGPDGALIEEIGDGRRHTLRRVLAWEPPYRILLEWRLSNFAAGEKTEVEVRFEPAGEETRVSIEQRGLRLLRPDHPARHGQGDPRFEITVGRWWRETLGFLKQRIEGPH
ncbi:MAG: SRPBCC domain-containing protein [Alphaproteobacteria bacterium]